MEFLWTLIIVSLISFIVVLIIAAIIRYAIDSSNTSRKLDILIKEVHYLKTEIKKCNTISSKMVANILLMRKYRKQNGGTPV